MNKKITQTLILAVLCVLLTACKKENNITPTEGFTQNPVTETRSRKRLGEMELKYADEFKIEYYEDDYVCIHIADGTDYVLVPEGCETDSLGCDNPVFIAGNSSNIYLAASSAMDLFLQLDALDAIKACSTTADEYAMTEVRNRIDSGDIAYVGKYSAPDYETLIGLNCNLAIESTMITHSPKIKEQLENIGIPVLVERSSYEISPMGRLEWIKLYGVLLGKEEAAFAFFEEQCAKLESLESELLQTNHRPTVVFFYISSNGYVNVRKPGDYITKMIDMAGGSYALQNLVIEEENALSTININWEDFYREAVNADILIYNGTIDGGVQSVDDLISKNELFLDFKAVKDGKVWCTGLNMFQESSKIADVVQDLHAVINDTQTVEIRYLYPLY